MTQQFTTPTTREPFAPPFERFRYDRGKTIYRSGGTWFVGQDFPWSTLRDADLVDPADRPGGERTDGTDRDRYLFLGGRTYTVSDAVASELTDAGYGEHLS